MCRRSKSPGEDCDLNPGAQGGVFTKDIEGNFGLNGRKFACRKRAVVLFAFVLSIIAFCRLDLNCMIFTGQCFINQETPN